MKWIGILTMVLGMGIYMAVYFLIKKYKIKGSVSATAFSWKRKSGEVWSLPFTLLCIFLGLGYGIAMLNNMQNHISFAGIFALLGAFGLLTTGVAWDYKSTKQGLTMHMVGSMGGIVAAVVAGGLATGQWWLVIAMGLFWFISYGFKLPIFGKVIPLGIKYKNTTFWVEQGALVACCIFLAIL